MQGIFVILHQKLLLLEALTRSAAAWALIRLTPYRFWKQALGAPADVKEIQAHAGPPQISRDVAWAHARIRAKYPDAFTCLMLALSARGMLTARGVLSALVLGARVERTKETRPLAAHAWVICAEGVVVGGEQMPGHVAIASYAHRASLKWLRGADACSQTNANK